MRRSVAFLALLIGAAGLVGCAHSGPASEPAPAATAPRALLGQASHEQKGPEFGAYTSPVRIAAGSMTGTLFLRAVPGASGTTELHLTIAHQGYWVIFMHAIDLEGRKYPVRQVGQNFVCNRESCTYYEGIVISLPDAALARAAHSGLVLRVSGEKKGYVAELPAGYVDGFLRGLAEREARLTGGAPERPVPAAPAP